MLESITLTNEIPLTTELVNILENAKNLKILHALENNSEEITTLDISSLEKLEDLRVTHTKLDNIILPKNSNVKTLILRDNNISNLEFLSGKTELEELELSNNKTITDISILGELTNLNKLYLDGTGIEEITSLSALNKLEALIIKNTKVRDISPINNLKLYRVVLENLSINPNYDDLNTIGKTDNAEFGTLNTLYLGTITLEDFNKLKTFAIRDVNVEDAKKDDNKPRELTFQNLIIEKTIHRSEITNGVVQLENPLINWYGEYIVQCGCNEENTNITFEGNKILVSVQDLTVSELVEKYEIYETKEDAIYGNWGQPASISGTITLKLKIVD